MTDTASRWAAPPDARERVRQLLCDLVAIPSFGANKGPIIRHLVKRFTRQSIPCRVTELDGKPLNVVAEVGEGPKTIILNSHVDAVPPGDPAPWLTDPLTPAEKDGRIYGRGTEDAKGCLASMIVAFEALTRQPDTLPAKVILMAMGGEERGGLGTRAEVARGVRVDAAIIGESTGLVPKMAHKGVLRLEAEVIGRAGHASDPEAGINAITAMGPVVVALDHLAGTIRRQREAYTGNPSLVISTISGGVALNVIPPRCTISIDRRVLPTETEADATQEIVKTVNGALPAASGATVEVRKVRFVPPAMTDPGAPIAAAAEAGSARALGRAVRAEGFTATCDMTYLVNDARIRTVILGPGDIDVAHQANEYMAIDQMVQAVCPSTCAPSRPGWTAVRRDAEGVHAWRERSGCAAARRVGVPRHGSAQEKQLKEGEA